MVDAPRDRYGRYLITKNGGKAQPYTRVTTISSTLSDSFGLTKWKLRTLAQGIALRDDIYARIAAADPTDKKQYDQLCETALEAGRSSAGANYGTALHEAVARLNRGEQVTMPAPWQGDLDAYTETLARVGVTVDAENVEQVCVLDELQIAGTFDLIVTLPDGMRAIADLKTGQDLSYSWNEIAIQLALYSRADDIVNPELGFRRPMPPMHQGLVIHLPAGKNVCTLHSVDIAEGWEAAQLAIAVRDWRKRKDLSTPYTHLGPAYAPPGVRDRLRARVEQIKAHGHLDALAERWPPGIPGLKGDHPHTADELAAVTAIVSELEALAGLPF